MSRLFDLRHRWGEPVHEGVMVVRTCSVCGRTDRAEIVVPDWAVAALVDNIRKANPYRDLFRLVP